MKNCTKCNCSIRAVLVGRLRSLYAESAKIEGLSMESAAVEGSIIQVQMLWCDLVGGNAPSETEIFQFTE